MRSTGPAEPSGMVPMENESHLLFVCTANLYRSQLAHACCAWMFGVGQQSARGEAPAAASLGIASAGIAADASLHTPPSVSNALLARGIPWTARPARRLRPSLVRDADVVLAMEEEQAARIRADHPASWRKVTTLGAFGAAARQFEVAADSLQERMRQLLNLSMNMPNRAHYGELDVKDPSTGEAAVEACLREIERHLSNIGARLFGR